MKKILSIMMILLLSLGLASCGGGKDEAPTDSTVDTSTPSTDESESESDSSSESTEEGPGTDVETEGTSTNGESTGTDTGTGEDNGEGEKDPLAEAKGFVIHYQREDKNYKTWALWLWAKAGQGEMFPFQDTDAYGGVYKVDFEDSFPDIKTRGLGLIVRKRQTDWVKDYKKDRFINFLEFECQDDKYFHIYLKENDGNIYISPEGDVNPAITDFQLNYNEKTKNFEFTVIGNKPIREFEIRINDKVVGSNTIKADSIIERTEQKIVFNYGAKMPELSANVVAAAKFGNINMWTTLGCNMSGLFQTKIFDSLYSYDGELGAIYTKEKTTFRLWSPVCQKVILRIYDKGTPIDIYTLDGKVSMPGGSNACQDYKMHKGPKGTWEYEVAGDLEGKYYTYIITNSQYQGYEVVDPYAKSTGINGLRGMVVDFSKTNPEGWDKVKLNGKKDQELVVYETHIADLTSSDTWNGTPANAKNYKGFYESGTTYTKNGKTVTTGFDHIKEMGVNTVQLLPIFDNENDERLGHRSFNWGYNPVNYNALDGGYSLNPEDGYEKIKEFKGLVQAYSNAGINIIMDVVYNHVSAINECNFNKIMPGYYFRYIDGDIADASGCGNETASNMPMYRKFMIDSTEFWASEYKLGGFRFDLMKIHDIETMNQLTKNLRTKVDPNITVYGEPWAAGDVAIDDYLTAKQDNMDRFEGYGSFNDQMRNALAKKPEEGRAWTTAISKDEGNIGAITNGIRGLVKGSLTNFEPSKCVNYTSCHDNHVLFDRISLLNLNEDPNRIRNMAMMNNSIVLTSQGINFFLAGEEFLRTKGGDHNSYMSSYEVNTLDWELKVDNLDIVENYKKLIALHNTTNLFSKGSIEAKNINLRWNNDLTVVRYSITDTINNKQYVIVHSNNFHDAAKEVNLQGYTLYLDTLNPFETKPLIKLNAHTKLSDNQTIIAYRPL